jgi:hypothetical protein
MSNKMKKKWKEKNNLSWKKAMNKNNNKSKINMRKSSERSHKLKKIVYLN